MRRAVAGRAPVLAAGLLVGTLAAAGEFDLDLAELNELSPRPGTRIEAANLAEVSPLLDADMARFIAGGYATVVVGPPTSFDVHPAYAYATQQFLGQPALSDNPGKLADFAQGRPFPGELRRDDAQAGAKAAWNMRYAYLGDSGLIPEMHWQLRDWQSEQVQVRMLFKARSMRFMYRHVEEPLPFIDKNPQDAYGAFLLTAVEAGSYDGSQALVFANRDESRELNGWVYIPQLGRTQTLASFSTSESMFGSDILPTDFLLYAGRMVDMRWRYLGTTYMLLPMYRHDQVELSAVKARDYDYWHVDVDGHAGCFPRVHWQLRPTIMLEGVATDPAARVSRRVFFLDRQTYVPALWKIYGADDALWKIAITAYAHPNSHLDRNRESGAPIPTAFSTIDIQSNRCTTLQLLTIVNPGDIQPADFDAGAMQSGGRGEFRRR